MNDVKKIGKYRVEGRLGQGGMGVVYKALDPDLDRPVALKTILPSLFADEEAKERLSREAQAAAKLQHPNVVTIYEFSEADDYLYIAMEYIDGQSLTELLKEPVPIERRIEIMIHTCRALAYAHENGIVHRDVKPSNILIGRDGTVKLLDFGIAHLTGSQLTRTGVAMGTPEYMSPEMVEGQELDKRSDIFSCGVILYEMLTKTKPFHHERMTTTLFNIINHQPDPLSEVRPELPHALGRVVAKLLEKKPENRYQDLGLLIDDLERILSKSVLEKAEKVRDLYASYDRIEAEIGDAGGGQVAASILTSEFGPAVEQLKERVQRFSNASDTSISVSMIVEELGHAEELRLRISRFSEEALPEKLKEVQQVSNLDFEDSSAETVLPPPPAPAPAAEPAPSTGGTPAASGGLLEKRGLLIGVSAGGVLLVSILALALILPGGESAQPEESLLAQTAQEEGPTGDDQGQPSPETTLEQKPDADPSVEIPDPAPVPAPPTAQELGEQLDQAFRERQAPQVLRLSEELESLGTLTGTQLRYQGWALGASGQHERAIKVLNESLKSAPSSVATHYYLGKSYWANGAEESAKNHIRQALDSGRLSKAAQREGRRLLRGMSYSFQVTHLHARRLGFIPGGKCTGSLTFNGDRIVYKEAQNNKHSQEIMLGDLSSISSRGKQVDLQPKRSRSKPLSFELPDEEGIEEVDWLISQVHLWAAQKGPRGTSFTAADR